MVKIISLIIFTWGVVFSPVSRASLFPNIDINSPNLTVEKAAKQCQKSLMHAPEQLEAWCEKAYSLGDWEALYYIGVHTGDGTRYLEEINSRIANNEYSALKKLAWIYRSGHFVKKDLRESARLYELYLLHDNEINFQTVSAHFELSTIYQRLGMWNKVITHTDYVINYANRADWEHRAKYIQKQAKASLAEN
tara:strand:+ start:887 stop:1465 length:579 start_codon:yes stop_codon:yes gene_type:complete